MSATEEEIRKASLYHRRLADFRSQQQKKAKRVMTSNTTNIILNAGILGTLAFIASMFQDRMDRMEDKMEIIAQAQHHTNLKAVELEIEFDRKLEVVKNSLWARLNDRLDEKK